MIKNPKWNSSLESVTYWPYLPPMGESCGQTVSSAFKREGDPHCPKGIKIKIR